MKFNPINLYKLHLNSVNNLVQGDGTGRFSLQIPQYYPKHKRCFVFVEYACLQVATGVDTIANDYFCINSNLISENSYSNNNKNLTGILCYFGKERYVGRANDTRYVEVNISTNPINVGYLPNQIELYISDSIDNTDINLPANMEFILTLCCQFVDDDEC